MTARAAARSVFVMIGRVSVIGLCSAGAVLLGGCAAASTASLAPAGTQQVVAAAASCAALTVSQQFSEDRKSVV